MDNQERRQEIEQLAATPSEDRLQLLSEALHSPVTVCSALSALKTIATPEALDIIQQFGLESGFTAQETDQLVENLVNGFFRRVVPRMYRRYDEIPIELLAVSTGITNETILTEFEKWRTQQAHPLVTIVEIDDLKGVRTLNRIMINMQPDMISLGIAQDAIEGGALVQRVRPDLIILDHMMPGLRGMEALDYIHNLVPDSKIIYHSFGAGDKALEREALEHGAIHVMSYYPQLIDQLTNSLRSVMGLPLVDGKATHPTG